MKKINRIILLILLGLYFLLLPKYFAVEEILGLYIIPVILVIIISTLSYLISGKLKRIVYKELIIKFLIVASIFQLIVLGLILWMASPIYFSREQVNNDIDYAIKVAEDVHPNLYSKISKDNFKEKVDSIKNTFPERISNIEAYRTFLKIFSQIHDGHTRAEWNYFTNRFSYLFRKALPYKIEIIDNRMYVTKNYFYRSTIPIGSEIIEINGKSVKQCLSETGQLVSYESPGYRNALLKNVNIWGLWNDSKSFEIAYQTPDSKKIVRVKTSGSLLSNILADQSSDSAYVYRPLSGNIGYIEFNSFNNSNKFKSFLKTTFRKIKDNNINNLIIDIRKNGGGNSSLGDELMQYVSKSDFRQCDSIYIKISKEILDRGLVNWLDSSKRIVGMLYSLPNISNKKLTVNPLRFKGHTYLLIGGKTFSAATDIASAFKCFNAGKVIGSETGGLTTCYGDCYTFDLPNTKLNISVSYKKFINACGKDDGHGVIPDYIVKNSFEDDRKGMDRVLEFTMHLINQENKIMNDKL